MFSSSSHSDEQTGSIDRSSNFSDAVKPLEAALIYFLAFEGLFCVAWMVSMWCDYSVGIPRMLTIIRGIVTLFYGYVAIMAWQRSGRSFRCFIGLSLPILVLLVATYCQMTVLNCFSGYRPYYYVLSYLCFPIMVLVFSIPLDDKNAGKLFYCVYVPIFLATALAFFSWHEWLLQGLTMRHHTFIVKEAKLIESLWGALGASCGSVGTIGALLGILSFSGWRLKWLPWPVFVVGYIAGNMLMVFSGFRSIYIGWLIVNLVMLFGSRPLKKKTIFLLISFLLASNSFSIFGVGFNDSAGLSKRFSRFFNDFGQDVGHIKTVIREVQETSRDTQKGTPNNPLGTQASEKDAGETPAFRQNVADGTPAFPSIDRGANMQKADSQDRQSAVSTDSRESTALIPAMKPITGDEIELAKSPFAVIKKAKVGSNDDYSFIKKSSSNVKNARIILARFALEAIVDNPIFGYGFPLILKIKDEYVITSPHCNILIMFMGLGMIGGTLFLVVIVRGFIDSVVVMRRRPEWTWLAMVFMFAFTANLLNTQVSYYNLLWLPLVVLRGCVRSLPVSAPECDTNTSTDRESADHDKKTP